jgi:cytochrome d ubiquinol oxidase subunit II
VANYATLPALWALPALGLVGRCGRRFDGGAAHAGAFVVSSLSIVGVIGTAGAAMFPFVMPSSTQPATPA